jgi:predicted adenylyl cyclase CyaB
MIEVEVRAFISKEKYDELVASFKRYGNQTSEDDQTTYYFSGPKDLRIQKGKNYSKIWLKEGKMHDETREEIEIMLPPEEFENLERLLLALGYNIEIKWFRKRMQFLCKDIEVSLDHTKGYGYIIELEKLATQDSKEQVLIDLKKKFLELGLEITPKREFDEKYAYYKNNWKSLVETE